MSVSAVSPEPARQFVYNLFINGREIGVGPSRIDEPPPGSVYSGKKKVLYYSTYDVTDIAAEGCSGSVRDGGGENGACVLIALCHTEAEKAFLARIGFYSSRGKLIEEICTGEAGWEALNADPVFRPDNSIGTHYYRAYASNIDAALWREISGKSCFEAPVIKDNAFSGYILTPAKTGPVKRFETEVPPGNTLKTAGGYRIDLGREIVGGLRAVIETAESTEIELRFGEELDADGSVKYRMRTGNVYLAHWHTGAGTYDIATPDMMTFRYVEMSSDKPFALGRICGLSLRADLKDGDSFFDSDSAILNSLWNFTKYTVKTTTQDLYVDSQSRERGAYEGDLLINMLASYTFFSDRRVARFSLEYLYTHRTWPAEYVLLTARAALADLTETGDTGSAEKYYPILKINNFLANRGGCGLVHSGNSGSSGTNAVLYDWPPSERDGYDTAVKYPTVLNALQVSYLYDMAAIARYLGREDDSIEYERLANELAAALIAGTYDAEKGTFCDGLYENGTRSPHCSQHAGAYALLALGKTFLSPVQAAGVCEYIRNAKCLKTSVYGAYFVLDGLYRSGVPGAAGYATGLMLSCDPDDRRTWNYMINRLGATLTAEAWCPENKPNMTFSHPWGAAPAVLIRQGIFGIEPLEPGYASFEVNFRREGIGRASIAVPTAAGRIEASFDGNSYRVAVPEGSTARIMVEDKIISPGAGPGEHTFVYR